MKQKNILKFIVITLLVFATTLGSLILFNRYVMKIKVPFPKKSPSPAPELEKEIPGKTMFYIKNSSKKESLEKIDASNEIKKQENYDQLSEYTYFAIEQSNLDNLIILNQDIDKLAEEADWQLNVDWETTKNIHTVHNQTIATQSAFIFPSKTEKLYIAIDDKLYAIENLYTWKILDLAAETFVSLN